jgi:hypothetical protein
MSGKYAFDLATAGKFGNSAILGIVSLWLVMCMGEGEATHFCYTIKFSNITYVQKGQTI